MLHLRHVVGDPELGSTFRQYELRSKDLLVVRSVHDGGRNDDAIEHALTTEGGGWSSVRFVLEGPLLFRHGRSLSTVHRGQAIASVEWRASPSRSLTALTDVLTLNWRAGSSLGPSAPDDGLVSLSPASRDALLRLARAIEGPDRARASGAAREALFALRAAGVPVAADAAIAPPPPEAHEVARALERVLFPLSSRPMAIDLATELGVGERQALRRANAFFQDYCAGVSTWRHYVHGMRVGLSTFFMSHPRARTAEVSRLLGFASPTSFCHALHEAGLPSPSALQRALLA